MLTTGFKLWFGFFVGAVLAAVFAGYTSGATETGPLSLGWKGGVGNHVSYTILATGAGVLALLGLVAVAFRDADAGPRPTSSAWTRRRPPRRWSATRCGRCLGPLVSVPSGWAWWSIRQSSSSACAFWERWLSSGR